MEYIIIFYVLIKIPFTTKNKRAVVASWPVCLLDIQPLKLYAFHNTHGAVFFLIFLCIRIIVVAICTYPTHS